MSEGHTTAIVPLAATTGSLLLGGSSTFLVNLAGAMQRRGFVLPVIVLSARNEHERDFAAVGNPVHCVSNRRAIYEDRLLAGYQLLRGYRPQAVLSCLSSESFEPLRVVPPGVARIGIIQSHDPGPYANIRAFSETLDAVIGVSEEICRHLRSLPELAHVHIERIPYGIEFAPMPPRSFNAAKPLHVIYLGRLIEEQKRVSRLAELARRLQEQKAGVQLTIAGDGPQRDSLRASLADCDIVTFREAVPYSTVPALLAEHDVFVLLSDYEGLPLSLLEAMGAGVVPVASDLESGIREVVTNGTGVRVPVGDVAAAADAIAGLARDRSTLEALSEAAARAVRDEYSAARMADRYLHLISRLARPSAEWPVTVRIPKPFGVRHPWLYDGFPRMARRWTKRLLTAGLPGWSSRG